MILLLLKHQQNEMVPRKKKDFHKNKNQTSINVQRKKIFISWTKKEESDCVDNWMKLIFFNKPKIYIVQVGDTRTYVRCREKYTVDSLREVYHLASFIMIWGSVSFLEQGEVIHNLISQYTFTLKSLIIVSFSRQKMYLIMMKPVFRKKLDIKSIRNIK